MSRPLAIAALAAGFALAAPAAAAADPASGEPVKGAAPQKHPAPMAPRLIDVPNAHLQPVDGAFAAAGASHRGDVFAAATAGLGGIAEVGLGLDDRVSGGHPAVELTLPVATFRVGVAADRLFRGQPDLALGFTRSIGDRAFAGFDVGADPGPESGDPAALEAPPTRLEIAELHLAATRRLAHPAIGILELTAGAALWDAAGRRDDDAGPGERLGARGLGAALRPFAGLAWNPGIYPRTTLLVDTSFAPVVTDDRASLAWRLAWGVRYQAVSWGSIELAVRHREDEGLRGSTVLVRLAAAFR